MRISGLRTASESGTCGRAGPGGQPTCVRAQPRFPEWTWGAPRLKAEGPQPLLLGLGEASVARAVITRARMSRGWGDTLGPHWSPADHWQREGAGAGPAGQESHRTSVLATAPVGTTSA